jgi:hypothetical protein
VLLHIRPVELNSSQLVSSAALLTYCCRPGPDLRCCWVLQDYFDVEAVDDTVARARGMKPETTAAIRKWMEENK